jgi:hypothetical protein
VARSGELAGLAEFGAQERDRQEHERPDDVELLLDRERPEVLQR